MRTSLATSTFRKGSLWFAIAAALLLGGLAAGVMLTPHGAVTPKLAERSPLATPTGAAVTSPSPAAEDITAAPVASVTQYSCTSGALTAAGAPPPVATIDALRVGAHAGYDRVVVEFSGAQPARIDLRPQANAAFTGSPRGDVVRLAGTRGIAVVIHGADMHTRYTGVRDVKTSFAGLAEVRVLEDFEGQVTLGLGLKTAGCYRAFVLTNPVRLVVDVQST